MDSVCRLCAEAKGPIDLIYKLDDLLAKLVDCCQWKWQTPQNEAKLPQNVCDECHDRLAQCWQFSCAVRDAQEKLADSIASNGANKMEFVDCAADAKISQSSASDERNTQHVGKDESGAESPETASDSGDSDRFCSEPAKPPAEADSDEEAAPTQGPATLTDAEYLALITDDARLENGQVEPKKIIDLNIKNWSMYQYCCWMCQTLHEDERAMLKHFDDRHPNGKHRWQCSLCPVIIEASSRAAFYLRFHVVKKHHPHLNYCCPICNMFFWDMEKKGKHIASFKHKLLRPRPPPSSFKCESCDRVLKSGNSLRTHRIEMHMNRDYSGLECYLCKLQIKTKIGLTHHMSRSHVARRPATSVAANRERNSICDLCGKAYYTKYQLKSHMEMHSIETNEPVECDVCHKTYKTQKALGNHKRLHLEKHYHCDQCDYRTHTAQRLAGHQARHGEKQHECEFCGNKFALVSTLKIHRRIHTGEKPYACRLCGYRSLCKSNVNKHMLQVHKQR